MRRIIIMNAKGGCGKTTISTNLASYYSVHGFPTALIDNDPQGSSSLWLSLRNNRPEIHGISVFKKNECDPHLAVARSTTDQTDHY